MLGFASHNARSFIAQSAVVIQQWHG